MRNKKLMALSLVAVLAFTACGKKETNEPTPTPTVAPTETPAATETPTETPAEPGTDGSGEELGATELTSNETLDKIHEEVKAAYGDNYLPNMPFTVENLDEMFGIKADWYDAAIAEGPMMSAHVDKLIGIHVTEGNLENVQNALNEYQKKIATDIQYPMNLPKVQASVVETAGDYVFFVMLGTIDEMKYTEDSDMIKAFGEQNQIAVDIIKKNIEAK
ncbi:DUF4358 domain-containing protein [Lachnoclostridium phytofermentans]|uniref:DUF4358 domain-containing protein n=1 Tax=Lachnoclostridium phytofermentans (strain ATCC 700394 / DSM 18823 / ISDg) TaxID=357809 RepID=A9KRY4_LACP7|nr:DUF4358 domain-containing protein [Lachnoclostridium phytofermentans]ABX40615.1 hypothetical protein Cphy_0228 [Lachnoclostridium phytofermentans ISDg]